MGSHVGSHLSNRARDRAQRDSGKPSLVDLLRRVSRVACQEAQARLQAITPKGYRAEIDIALTDEWPIAQALVIISAIATQQT